jgi:site-specific recombinase XerD
MFHEPTSALPAVLDPEPFSEAELFALAGFLAGYSGMTYQAYALDLRQYASYCIQHQLPLFGVRRAHIETFARQLEHTGRSRATIARRRCTITCFYRYAEQEGLIEHSPAIHVRRPRLDYESHATGLDRNELGAMLVVAGLANHRDHALVSLLALNGLRVSEAVGADIEDLGLERGHRTITVLRKGGKTVLVPMAPRTARTVDLAVAERASGPIFLRRDGRRLDRHSAARVARRVARRAGITKRVGPHTLRQRVHHRGARRRRPASRRPRSRQPRRSPHHDALRPRPRLPRPARHLHREHLHRRSRQITHTCALA